MADECKPWERMDGEPNRWYLLFDRYRRLPPPRSLRAYYQTVWQEHRVAKSPAESDVSLKLPNDTSGKWKEMSKRWHWEERAEAWDEAERQREEAEWETRRREQRAREWALGALMQERAKQALELGIYYDEEGEIAGVKLPEIKASDIPKLADVGSKLARLATGEPTDSVEVRDGSLTDADRAARIATLLERARARRAGSAADGDQPG